jgi:pentatricopeptide repeat-containing protein PET309
MLERASTCLESGGRQLFRTPTPCLCLRSRPAPYAALRHHAAPATTAAAVPDCPSGDVVDSTAALPASPAPLAPTTTLDFLYPEKTLELIRRLSTTTTTTTTTVHNAMATVTASASRHPRPRPRPLAGIRQYSTAPLQPHPIPDNSTGNTVTASTTTITPLNKEEKCELQDPVQHAMPAWALRELLRRGEPGKQDLAWRLWDSITPWDMRKVPLGLMRELIKYAVVDNATPDMRRILQVYHTIPKKWRTSATHRSVILAYLSLDQLESAVEFHDVAKLPLYPGNFDFGTDVILQRTVARRRWDLSLQTFQSFLRHKTRTQNDETADRIRKGDPLLKEWGQVAQLPALHNYFQDFLRYVRQHEQELRSSQERSDSLNLFAQSLYPHVVSQVLHVDNPDERSIWNYFTKLFDDLQSLNLALPSCYECTIRTMLNISRYRQYTNSPRKLWLLLYRQYRRRSMGSKTSPDHMKPSLDVIWCLITLQASHGNLTRVRELIQDIRIFYPGQPIPAGILEQCIHLHSKHGEVSQVAKYFEEYRSNYEAQIDLKLMSALIYVHARRIDVVGAIKQFNRIHQDYGLIPDQTCWNNLLLAHVRAEDLDGALECFNHSLEAGIKPDGYTFGPLLAMCTNRGDIEAFETLYSKAKEMYIPLDTEIRTRSGYVGVFINAGDPRGAEAIAQDMLKSWKVGVLRGHSLTHTWNIMIQYYAVRGDVTSCRRLYREMVQNKIPLDSSTFSHLMRSLIEIKQTNAAYKILRKTMPANNLRVLAIHYAIVMIGFLRERQYDLAMQAYNRMIERKVPGTETSRIAALETVGTIEKLEMQKDSTKYDPTHRLKKVEALIFNMLASGSGRETAHDQPRTSRFIDMHTQDSVPASYYSFLIKLYSARKAYMICKEIIRKARESQSRESRNINPISFLTAIMEFYCQTRKFKEVEKCWKLALEQAHRLVKTFHDAMHPEADPDASASPNVARNRRQVLVSPTQIYLRSLIARGDPESLQLAQHTAEKLLMDGFVVNSLTWNELVQGLANGGHVTDAFAMCEKYLMPKFPGWRVQNPHYIRNEIPGYAWMDLRHYDVERNSLLPRYKTMVVLANKYAAVRQNERDGIGYDEATRTWLRESLDNVAPLTVMAIETMPRTQDQIQVKFLSNA